MQRASSRRPGCLSDLVIDRLLVGELNDDDRAVVFEHADECAPCSRRIDEFRAAQAIFAKKPIPLHPRRSRSTTLRALGAFAAAAALVLLVARPEQPPPAPDTAPAAPDVVRTKGRTHHLGLYSEQDGALVPLVAGERIAPGARVQPTYSATEPVHLALFGVDGAGRVQRHFPDETSTPGGALLQPARDAPLPFSLTFDATPGDEVLVAVFCPHELDTAAIARNLKDGASPMPGPNCAVDRIVLPKDSR